MANEQFTDGLYRDVESAFQDYRNDPSAQNFDKAFKIGLNAMGLDQYAEAIIEQAKALSVAGRYSYEEIKKAAESANQKQFDNMQGIVDTNINIEKTIAQGKIGVVGFFENIITFVRAIDDMILGGNLSKTLDSFEDKLDSIKENIQNELSASDTRINDGQLAQGIKAQQSRVTGEAENISTRETGSYANSFAPSTGNASSTNDGIGNNDQILTKREFTLMAAQNGMTPAQIDGVGFDTIAGSDNSITGEEGIKLIEALTESGAQEQSINETASSVIGELRPVGP